MPVHTSGKGTSCTFSTTDSERINKCSCTTATFSDLRDRQCQLCYVDTDTNARTQELGNGDTNSVIISGTELKDRCNKELPCRGVVDNSEFAQGIIRRQAQQYCRRSDLNYILNPLPTPISPEVTRQHEGRRSESASNLRFLLNTDKVTKAPSPKVSYYKSKLQIGHKSSTTKKSAQPREKNRATATCSYRTNHVHRCQQPCAVKANGMLHSLCETHRSRQNETQKRSDRRRKAFIAERRRRQQHHRKEGDAVGGTNKRTSDTKFQFSE